MLLCQLRVNFDARLGILLDQRTDAPRLRAGEELADDAAGGQDHRKLGIDVFRGRPYSATLKRALPSGK